MERKRVGRVLDKVFERLVDVNELERMNRQFLVGGGLLDDVFGQEFNFKATAKGFMEKGENSQKDFSAKSIFDMVKDPSNNLTKLNEFSQDFYSSTKDRLSQMKQKSTEPTPQNTLNHKENIKKLNTNVYLCILRALQLSQTSQNPETDTTLTQLLTHVCKSICSTYISTHPATFEHLILSLHHTPIRSSSLTLLTYRMSHLHQSPYEILEPLILSNWAAHGPFTGKNIYPLFIDEFRYVFRTEIYK